MDTLNITIDNGLALVKFLRQEQRNTLNLQMMEELRDTARMLADNTDVCAVIVYGDPVFSAGADLSTAAQPFGDQAPSKLEVRHALKLGPDMCQAWEDIEAYTIAAIEGYCIGGASALVAAMDYRIAGESAFFRLPEVPLGINMSWGTVPRLVAQIGPSRTKEYVMFGRRVPAEQALQWGLCEQVTPDGETLAAAQSIANDVRALPPLPMRMTKTTVNAIAYTLGKAAGHMDRDQYYFAAQTEDATESLNAFMQKRSPKFSGN